MEENNLNIPMVQSVNPVAPENVSPPPPPIPEPKVQNNSIIIIMFSILLLILIGAVAFLYYQNQQLKGILTAYQAPISSPTPVATTDPTANWKTYTDPNGYQFKYPQDWVVANSSSEISVSKNGYKVLFPLPEGFGPGICIFSDSPNFNNPYTDNPIMAASKCPGAFIEIKGQQFTIRRLTTPNTSPEGVQNGNWSIYVKSSTGEFVTVPPISYQTPTKYDNSIVLMMDQILSSFKFTEATSSGSPTPRPVACTMEAKLCPDGSYVGRSGPNCEFAPCPK